MAEGQTYRVSPVRDRVVVLPHRKLKIDHNRRIEPFAPLVRPTSGQYSSVDNAGFLSESLQGEIEITGTGVRAHLHGRIGAR